MRDFAGGPGFMAFVFTFAVVIIALLLFRSLGKHLRKVRTNPPEFATAAEAPATGKALGTEDRDGGRGVVAQEPNDR